MSNQETAQEMMSSALLACSLPTGDKPKRSAEVADLLALAEEEKPLSDGFAFRYPGDAEWAQKVTDFIVTERDCCPFFSFEVHFEPNNGSIWLVMRDTR